MRGGWRGVSGGGRGIDDPAHRGFRYHPPALPPAATPPGDPSAFSGILYHAPRSIYAGYPRYIPSFPTNNH